MGTKKILFIEDNEIKAKDVTSFILEKYPNYEVVIKDSFRGGVREIIKNSYDLLLLDMSLPTWDRKDSRSNEGFERFGGITIMREMKRKKREFPTVVITMFNEFGIGKTFIDLSQLNNHLVKEFSSFYLGYVQYVSRETKWKEELQKFL
jgi:CheY-like chemotaxis protein